MKNEKVEVQVVYQGDAVCGKEGYLLKKGTDVVSFYLDGWGNTGRIYPVSSSSSVYEYGKVKNFPSLTLEDGDENTTFTEIYFPEFEGWGVRSVSGGKTMAICLTKE